MNGAGAGSSVNRQCGLRARVRDVRREQLEAAVQAVVRETPDAVVAEHSALVGDLPEMVWLARGLSGPGGACCRRRFVGRVGRGGGGGGEGRRGVRWAGRGRGGRGGEGGGRGAPRGAGAAARPEQAGG